MERFNDRKEALEAAKMRATLQAARTGGVPARLQGRRAGALPQLTALPGPSDPCIALLKSETNKKRVFDRAAAVWLGNDIAMCITPSTRAALRDAMGEDARGFAVKNRKLARMPEHLATITDDEPECVQPLLDAFALAQSWVGSVWANRLPAPLDAEMRPDDAVAPPDDATGAQLERCFDAALGAS